MHGADARQCLFACFIHLSSVCFTSRVFGHIFERAIHSCVHVLFFCSGSSFYICKSLHVHASHIFTNHINMSQVTKLRQIIVSSLAALCFSFACNECNVPCRAGLLMQCNAICSVCMYRSVNDMRIACTSKCNM